MAKLLNKGSRKNVARRIYFYNLTRQKPVTPLTVKSALSVREQMGQKGTEGLSELQKKIMQLIEEKGKVKEMRSQKSLI